jgi:hypothetical protein
MPLSEPDRKLVVEFRSAFERAYAGDARFLRVVRDDRTDDSVLATRFAVLDDLWLDLTLRPFVPQLRAGIVTVDRWKNEELEERIEETGDTMSEFLELGFDEAGLDWHEPQVEHYRDQGRYFYFATGLELPSLRTLAEPATLERARRMMDGYYHAFRGAIERLKAAVPPVS